MVPWPCTVPRLDSQVPYLRILFVTVYVRDVDHGIRFYVDQLGEDCRNPRVSGA